MNQSRRNQLYEVIFEADTPAGKAFDVVLLWSILISVAVVLLESVEGIRDDFGPVLVGIEWFFTILFTIEYLIRLICVRHPLLYARSFFGIVDLLSILPTYLSLFIGGSQALIVIRALRLLRVFRIFKLARYVGEAGVLMNALRASRAKITVFLVAVLSIVLIVGSLMYLIEGSEAQTGFTSIPASIYWTIVTMTTVGYGDIAPQTVLGKFVASVVMIIGYAIIAVPTGIVTAELSFAAGKKSVTTQVCPDCHKEGHDPDATHCKFCGAQLNETLTSA
ncbi:MAG: ion transporter [Candidatus Zixiibacteriota bacterium]|nr:MAG: ion transporter [candidate division Zixibacteria bacterium]